MIKKKRLTGEAYWRLYDLQEEGEKTIKQFGEWARKKCRELDLLPDVTDFLLGVVFDEPVDPSNPAKFRRQVKNIEDEAALARAAEFQAELDVINDKRSKLIRQIAMAAKVRPDQIDARNGVINFSPPDEEIEDLELTLPSTESD